MARSNEGGVFEIGGGCILSVDTGMTAVGKSRRSLESKRNTFALTG